MAYRLSDSSYVKSSLAIIQVFPSALQCGMAGWPVRTLLYKQRLDEFAYMKCRREMGMTTGRLVLPVVMIGKLNTLRKLGVLGWSRERERKLVEKA